RQASVVLRGSTGTAVVYSYAHLPLLIGLAAMSAGMRLVIERAGESHLGLAASAVYLGGIALFLVSLVGTRVVTIGGRHLLGLSMKGCTVAALLGLLVIEGVLPPVALAAWAALVLSVLV